MTTTKERGIVMNAQEVRGSLDGTRTQFRRVIKAEVPSWIKSFGYSLFTPKGSISGRGYTEEHGSGELFYPVPFGMPGNRLYVKETFSTDETDGIIYRASYDECRDVRWSSAVTMPRNASRILLEIVSAQAGRVQDITPAGCMSEGMEGRSMNAYVADCLLKGYAKIWDTTHKDGEKFKDNPATLIVNFRRIQP